MLAARWFMAGWVSAAMGLVVACGGSSSSSDDDSSSGKGGSGGSTTSGSGGTSGASSGGSGGGTIGSNCSSFTACGGNVVGSWKLASICNDTGVAGLPGADCTMIHGTPTFNSDASFDFKADGTYSVTGQIQFSVDESFDDACAMSTFMQSASAACTTLNEANAASAQTGFTFDCTASTGVCDCQFSATVPQNETGSYVVTGNSITLTPDAGTSSSATTTPLDGTSDFCVDGSTVTVKGSDGTISTLTK